MQKKKMIVNNAPTDKRLDDLWAEAVKARANYRSEVSGFGKHTGDVIQAHHIFHKPNHRLRWELKNGICLTVGEHKSYHEFEKRAFKDERKKADDLRAKFCFLRNVTEDEMLILKRQTGGVDKFAVMLYLKQAIERFTAVAR